MPFLFFLWLLGVGSGPAVSATESRADAGSVQRCSRERDPGEGGDDGNDLILWRGAAQCVL